MRPPVIPLPPTIVRFAAVGAANTAIDVALFWVLQAPVGILCANVVSTSAGMVFSFAVNGRHTFGATRVSGRQALTFLASNAFTMWLVQPLVIGTAHGLLATPLVLAKVVALGVSVVGTSCSTGTSSGPTAQPTPPKAGSASARERRASARPSLRGRDRAARPPPEAASFHGVSAGASSRRTTELARS